MGRGIMRVIQIPSVREREVSLSQVTNEDFLQAVINRDLIKRIHFLSRTNLIRVKSEFDNVDIQNVRSEDRNRFLDSLADRFTTKTVSQFVSAVHMAYDQHLPLSLSPEVLWYVISHEIAFHVKSNAGQYAHLFTKMPSEKQLIEVQDDTLNYDAPSDWLSAINLFRKPLREHLPTGIMELCLPQFSTLTLESETAITVNFMDTVSKYFDFMMTTLCGIPAIRMEGSIDDWKLLAGSVRSLSEYIVGLEQYFEVLQELLDKLVTEYESSQPDYDFWTSFYKVIGGSGGPYVNGWINVLFAHGYSWQQDKEDTIYQIKSEWQSPFSVSNGNHAITTNKFPSHVSRVDFIWNYYGNHIPMMLVSGVFGTEMEDGFLTPKLGVGVIEKM